MFDQAVARKEISKAIRANKVSLRQLATKIGLKGHAALSRFLSGKQRLSLESILLLAKELGIEGRSLDRILRSQIPSDFINSTEDKTSKELTSPEVVERENVKIMPFFFHEKMPLVYDVLKVLGSATPEQIRKAFHSAVKCSVQDIRKCLGYLLDQHLVKAHRGVFTVIDPSKDIVIPSKYSNEIGKRIIRETMHRHSLYVNETADHRMMRSIVTTLPASTLKQAIEQIKPPVLRFQDDLLSLQKKKKDQRVISVLVSVTHVTQ